MLPISASLLKLEKKTDDSFLKAVTV